MLLETTQLLTNDQGYQQPGSWTVSQAQPAISFDGQVLTVKFIAEEGHYGNGNTHQDADTECDYHGLAKFGSYNSDSNAEQGYHNVILTAEFGSEP